MAGKKASVGIQQLIDRTAGPNVEAKVVVDQIYAKFQHESLDLRHPRGGRAKFLEFPLFENRDAWIEEFAVGLLNARTSAANRWGGLGRKLVRRVAVEAPIEFGDLRQSGALTVKEGGSVIIDEPAIQRRLTEEEIDAKKMLSMERKRS